MNQRKTLRRGVALCLGLLLMLAGCGGPATETGSETPVSPTAAPIPLVPHEEIGTFPDSYAEGSAASSVDGQEFAYVIETSAGQQAVWGEWQSNPSSAIGRLQFSPEANDLFFWFVDSSAGEQKIALSAGGTIITTDCAAPGRLVFSLDGRHWAAICGGLENQGTTGFVVVYLDAIELGRYADGSYPAFSPDGEHLAYLARTEAPGVALYEDGRELRRFEEGDAECSAAVVTSVSGPNLPPQFAVNYLSDGSLSILTLDQNCWTIYRDDTAVSSYPHSVWGGLNLMVIAPEELETQPTIWAASLSKAESAPVLVWWERQGGEQEGWRVVKDGQPIDSTVCANFWSSWVPVVSPDGTHVAYACVQEAPGDTEGDVHLLVDGRSYGPYRNVSRPALSADGQHVAYAAAPLEDPDKWHYYLDGNAFTLAYDRSGAPFISADGANTAWRATREEKAVLVLNDQEVGVVDELLWGPKFVPGYVSWIVREGDMLVRLNQAVP